MGSREQWVPADVDVGTPSAARLYDYYLGGGYNFAADRELAQRIFEVFPQMPHLARANRNFLRRAVTYLAEQGVDQFLDIGCGLPSGGAVHEIAGRHNPRSRVVYVDNEPVAVAHSELMLDGLDTATVVQADLTEPDAIFRSPAVRELLDPSRPMAVLLVAVMHFVGDEQDPSGILRAYREWMPAGSSLVFSHVSGDTLPDVTRAAELYRNSQNPAYLRGYDEIAAMLDGFTLVDPGLVFVPAWRPDEPGDADGAEQCSFYGAVGTV
ncbi:precorrin-6B methylase 2 [Saccharopolyspora lacisalsi]|uniref:Precorrin-6B methylase 2 n=1 Tax=Halosaccharopolyspora lacisalsi TaxID=1000566 RepID=A0A839E0E4_9PSEU|nr:SAM-dependent methyltransferase [Halosaccharopolyspora lacisalsi]MBA8826389.1 precorrin-6B methylase 2 [Halosaccharopolyspora lacisalsi]